MAVGRSGRVVIEIEPTFKRELRAALERDGVSMKDWFLEQARRYLERGGQTELGFARTEKDRKRV
jgi:hypothetical protein